MKKVLLAIAALAAQIASPALAADWPVIAPTYEVPPPPAVYSWWTGCYLGGNVGGAWARPHYTHDDSLVVESFEFTPVGIIGGGQVGCQYQWNSLVFGLEGTYSWGNVQQHQPGTVLSPGAVAALVANRDRSIEISQIGTVTARLGYVWDRTMLYAKGGWAGVRISARASCESLTITAEPRCVSGSQLATGTFSDFIDWSNGWTVGVGLEHVPWQNLVVGVEANVYGGFTFDHAGQNNVGNPIRFFNTDATIYAITVRASYLFGQPIATRYVN